MCRLTSGYYPPKFRHEQLLIDFNLNLLVTSKARLYDGFSINHNEFGID